MQSARGNAERAEHAWSAGGDRRDEGIYGAAMSMSIDTASFIQSGGGPPGSREFSLAAVVTQEPSLTSQYGGSPKAWRSPEVRMRSFAEERRSCGYAMKTAAPSGSASMSTILRLRLLRGCSSKKVGSSAIARPAIAASRIRSPLLTRRAGLGAKVTKRRPT